MMKVTDAFADRLDRCVPAETMSAWLAKFHPEDGRYRVVQEEEPWHVYGVGGTHERRTLLVGPRGVLIRSSRVIAYDTSFDDSADQTIDTLQETVLVSTGDAVAAALWSHLCEGGLA